jgi:hypothetical protein
VYILICDTADELKSLTIWENFNKPLRDSLKSLPNLESLGYFSEYPLGDSLKGLTSLQFLTFGHDFIPNDKDLHTRLQQFTDAR